MNRNQDNYETFSTKIAKNCQRKAQKTSEKQTQPYTNIASFKKTNLQLFQTTVQQNLILDQRQQASLNPKVPLIKNQSKASQSLTQKQQIKTKSYLMEMINHYIYEIAERNQAIHTNYAHFLVLLYLTLQQIALNIYPSENLSQAKRLIFLKLQQQSIKRQLDQATYYDFMTLILRKQKISPKLIHTFMRSFMTMERYVCIAVFPYYFNMFAIVLNKQVIFNGEPNYNLIPYTFEIPHQKRFNGNFSRQQVLAQMRRVEKLSIEKYHSQQL